MWTKENVEGETKGKGKGGDVEDMRQMNDQATNPSPIPHPHPLSPLRPGLTAVRRHLPGPRGLHLCDLCDQPQAGMQPAPVDLLLRALGGGQRGVQLLTGREGRGGAAAYRYVYLIEQ